MREGGREGGRESYTHSQRALVTMENKEKNRKKEETKRESTKNQTNTNINTVHGLKTFYRPYRARYIQFYASAATCVKLIAVKLHQMMTVDL